MGRLQAVLVCSLAGWPLGGQIASEMFRHHSIHRESETATPVPGYGSPVVADFDRDGDLDFAVWQRNGKVYWFENRGKEPWRRHEVGDLPVGQLGAVTLDVDGDGWPDIIVGGFWYRNPQQPAAKPFERYRYDASIDTEIHDMAVADIDGDGKADIAALGDREGCFWYRVPEEAVRDVDWPKTVVTMAVVNDKDDIHGGLAPRGVADLDGDGDPDIALTDRWYENRNKGAEWVQHPLPFGKRGPWGLSSRSWIIDLDGDGDNDIIVTDSDQKDSRVAWLENDGQRPPTFRYRAISEPAPETRGSLHSLAVADFDGDGDPDILSVEQEDPSILPEGGRPRWFVWENLDGKGGRFAEHVIFDGRLGGHDVQVADVDGDGDPDIASKIWRQWTGNANNGLAHVDWLENLVRRDRK